MAAAATAPPIMPRPDGEGGMDGHNDNLSWNHGAEGETDDNAINDLRFRQMRNFMTTLLVSQGVPMILHGDEFGRSQGGNNNAYCQDNDISWMKWNLAPRERQMLEWTRRAVQMRRDHPVFRRRRYFQGRAIRGAGVKDISWLQPDGSEMTDEAWDNDTRIIGVYIAGAAADLVDERGDPATDDNVLLLLNPTDDDVDFTLPTLGKRRTLWRIEADTARPREQRRAVRGDVYKLERRSMAVLINSQPVH